MKGIVSISIDLKTGQRTETFRESEEGTDDRTIEILARMCLEDFQKKHKSKSA
jgi:hypothetical protein